MRQDLFAQARILATLDPKKPKQANLRRAISSTYYALFHALVQEACGIQIGTAPTQAGYRHALGRAFVHTTIKQACVSFRGGTLKAAVVKGLPLDEHGNYPIPKEIRVIAATFVELQEKRHLADYDLSERFIRSEVLALIEQAERYAQDFGLLPPSDVKRFFLACLWAWKELTN